MASVCLKFDIPIDQPTKGDAEDLKIRRDPKFGTYVQMGTCPAKTMVTRSPATKADSRCVPPA